MTARRLDAEGAAAFVGKDELFTDPKGKMYVPLDLLLDLIRVINVLTHRLAVKEGRPDDEVFNDLHQRVIRAATRGPEDGGY